MDLSNRVDQLDEEMKLIKNEIKQVLLEVQEQILNVENPFTRVITRVSEDPGSDAPPRSEPAPVADPAPMPEPPPQTGPGQPPPAQPSAPAQPIAPMQPPGLPPGLPPGAFQQPMPVAPGFAGAPVQPSPMPAWPAQAEAGPVAPPGPPPPSASPPGPPPDSKPETSMPKKAGSRPGLKVGAAKNEEAEDVSDDEETDSEDSLRPMETGAVDDSEDSDYESELERAPEKPRPARLPAPPPARRAPVEDPPDDVMDLVTIAGLAQWTDQIVRKAGREHAEALLEVSEMTGRITAERKETLLAFVRLIAGNEDAGSTSPRELVSSLAQLDVVLGVTNSRDARLIPLLLQPEMEDPPSTQP